jgi:ornithine carbamoyltransferase
MFEGLRGRNLTSITDLSRAEIEAVLLTARGLKATPRGDQERRLEGRSLAMIFQKASTRTRVSFEVAMEQLGGHALYLNASDLQLGRGETVADTARVLSSYVDAIMARVFSHDDILELARHSSVPVINGLSDFTHPCQILADLLTVLESGADLSRMFVCYIGDSNNVTNSLMFAAARLGYRLVVCSPPGYQPSPEVLKKVRELNPASRVEIQTDPKVAASGADFLYTDVWASMGQEAESAERRRVFAAGGYRIDGELLKVAGPNARVLHCLPAHRGEEISSEVLDGPQSIVFQQAENRLHAQKALLLLMMGGIS